jgi:hypothetical protein
MAVKSSAPGERTAKQTCCNLDIVQRTRSTAPSSRTRSTAPQRLPRFDINAELSTDREVDPKFQIKKILAIAT